MARPRLRCHRQYELISVQFLLLIATLSVIRSTVHSDLVEAIDYLNIAKRKRKQAWKLLEKQTIVAQMRPETNEEPSLSLNMEEQQVPSGQSKRRSVCTIMFRARCVWTTEKWDKWPRGISEPDKSSDHRCLCDSARIAIKSISWSNRWLTKLRKLWWSTGVH